MVHANSIVDSLTKILIAKARKRGAQPHNDNAAKDHVVPVDLSDLPYKDSINRYLVWRDAWASRRTPEQLEAVRNYGQGWSAEINKFLRRESRTIEPQDRQDAKQIKLLISALEPAPEDITVYRGVNNYPEHSEGSTFRDKGFVSTSAAKGRTFGFGIELLKINIPKGAPILYGIYGGESSLHASEQEIILPPWSHFKLKSKTMRKLSFDDYGAAFKDSPMYELDYVPYGKKWMK